MDDQRREIPGGGLFARDGFIEQVGPSPSTPAHCRPGPRPERACCPPGLVNTHHHFYQTLTRAVPAAQDANLFNWLKTLYPIWARMTPEDIFISTQTALAELALSGCTTASDHLYLFPNGSRLDDEIEAARAGGPAPARLARLDEPGRKPGRPAPRQRGGQRRAHPGRLAAPDRSATTTPNPARMLQIVLAPCSPFSVTGDLMRQSAPLARQYGVHLHTHLAETQDEEAFCLEKFGYRPVGLHAVASIGSGRMSGLPTRSTSTPTEIERLRPTPAAAWRTAPPRICAWPRASPRCMQYLRGRASRWAWAWTARPATTARTCWPKRARRCCWPACGPALDGASLSGRRRARQLMTARQALELATRGGAAVLGRSDIGSLEVGQMRRLLRHPPGPPGLRRRAARPGGGAGLLRPSARGLERGRRAGGRGKRPPRPPGYAPPWWNVTTGLPDACLNG